MTDKQNILNFEDMLYFYDGLAIIPTKPFDKNAYHKFWNYNRYNIGDFKETDNVSIQTGSEVYPGWYLCTIDVDINADEFPYIIDFIHDNFNDTVIVKSGGGHNGFHVHYLTKNPAKSNNYIVPQGIVEIKAIGDDGSVDAIMIPPSIVLRKYIVIHPYNGDYIDFSRIKKLTINEITQKLNNFLNNLNKIKK